ncbi:hypothetical protein BGW39_002030 [Mortierella sp. 14UC]|nr:hypothetical protein BGW39_002030 [Mortierella sp. 14UC]
MKYSVKPVLGVLAPNESVKIFVRCDNWISPQDRFLLQSIVLTDNEVQCIDSRVWKTLDPKRFIECYIPCVSVSVLSLRDPEDDVGSLSSSSATSSSTTSSYISPPLQATDLTRLPPPQLQRSTSSSFSGSSRQQIFERWQYSETMRPTVSMGGVVGRRLSSSSSSSTTSPSLGATTSPISPGGSYPTLFTPITTPKSSMDYCFPSSPTTSESGCSSARSSKRNSISIFQSGSGNSPNIITTTIVEESMSLDALPSTPSYYHSKTHSNSHGKPSSSPSSVAVGTTISPGAPVEKRNVLEKLGLSMSMSGLQRQQQQSRLMALWEHIRGRILVLSLVCLFFGFIFPLAHRSTQRSSNAIEMDMATDGGEYSANMDVSNNNNNLDAVLKTGAPAQSTNVLLGGHLKED